MIYGMKQQLQLLSKMTAVAQAPAGKFRWAHFVEKFRDFQHLLTISTPYTF